MAHISDLNKYTYIHDNKLAVWRKNKTPGWSWVVFIIHDAQQNFGAPFISVLLLMLHRYTSLRKNIAKGGKGLRRYALSFLAILLLVSCTDTS